MCRTPPDPNHGSRHPATRTHSPALGPPRPPPWPPSQASVPVHLATPPAHAHPAGAPPRARPRSLRAMERDRGQNEAVARGLDQPRADHPRQRRPQDLERPRRRGSPARRAAPARRARELLVDRLPAAGESASAPPPNTPIRRGQGAAPSPPDKPPKAAFWPTPPPSGPRTRRPAASPAPRRTPSPPRRASPRPSAPSGSPCCP